MSITSTFQHKLEHDFEQYVFPSKLNPEQRHFIDRDGTGPWQLSIVDHPESLSNEQAKTLIREVELLCEFMEKLITKELHRSTEPGEPDLAGQGGGL